MNNTKQKGDALGNRMKSQYENRTRSYLPRRTYTIIRVDGKAFHTFTKGMKKPFDNELMDVMDKTAVALCEQIQGAKLAYVQSDEISILLTDFEAPTTQAWFDGNVQKMSSIAASIATARFNFAGNYSLPAMFDARVFTIPDPVEVENYFIWRQQDATRNSIQMAARALYSHNECNNKNTSELQDMMMEKGVNWNDYTPREKRGSVIMKKELLETNMVGIEVLRSYWSADEETPIFTQDRAYLSNLIPKYRTDG